VTVRVAPLAAGTANAGYVVSASNDANTASEFFVFATGAPSTPPAASGGGGGGALDVAALALFAVAATLRVASARRPVGRG
jgi:hypothetical protein